MAVKYSVIIPTRNRSLFLIKALDCVINQTVDPNEYEVLVVDDGSTDDTRGEVLKYKEVYPEHTIRYFFFGKKARGSAAARNFGIKKAAGEIIFFQDDDTFVPPNWMESYATIYEKYPEIAGAGGWHRYPDNENRFFQKMGRDVQRFFGIRYTDKPEPFSLTTNDVAVVPNVSFRKKILEAVGGFDENVQWLCSADLNHRLLSIYKAKMMYVPVDAIHNCTLGFWGFIRKLIRHGWCKAYIDEKHFKEVPYFHQLFDTSFLRAPKKLFRIYVRIINNKKVGKVHLPHFFVYYFFIVFFNAVGGSYYRLQKFFCPVTPGKLPRPSENC